MKLEIRGNVVNATAETTQECIDLVALARSYKEKQEEARGPYKKKLKMKTCQVCGKNCKGNLGHAIHMNMHKKHAQQVQQVHKKLDEYDALRGTGSAPITIQEA